MNWMNKTVYVLNKNSESVKYLIKKDKRFEKVVDLVGKITYMTYSDPYIFLLDTIIGQMLSNKVADILTERVHQLCNDSVTPDAIALISDEKLREVGISYSKISFIRNLTNAINSKELSFENLNNLSDEEVIKIITKVKGIGPWSAKMFLIFVMNRSDVLPYEDVAFLQGYKWMFNARKMTPSAIKSKCTKWHPYCSVAARFLYKILDRGFTKKPYADY